jgi:hypothetical protein
MAFHFLVSKLTAVINDFAEKWNNFIFCLTLTQFIYHNYQYMKRGNDEFVLFKPKANL